jgi:SAM-dependent methyltransferase
MGGTGHVVGDARVDGHLPSAERLIDLGCGDGSWLDDHSGSEAIGIDLDATRLRPGRQGRAWTFVSADLDEGIPLDDAWAHAVRANQVVEHIRNPVRLFAEAYRVLRPGGVFVATTPNVRYVKHILRLAIRGDGPMTSQRAERSAVDWDDGHIHYFTAHDLEWLAGSTGFSTYHTEALVDRAGGFSALRRILDRQRTNFLVKAVLCGNVLLVARK